MFECMCVCVCFPILTFRRGLSMGGGNPTPLEYRMKYFTQLRAICGGLLLEINPRDIVDERGV